MYAQAYLIFNLYVQLSFPISGIYLKALLCQDVKLVDIKHKAHQICCYGGANFKPFVDDVIYSCFPVIIVLFVLNYYTYRMQDGWITSVPSDSCLLRPMVLGVGSA